MMIGPEIQPGTQGLPLSLSLSQLPSQLLLPFPLPKGNRAIFWWASDFCTQRKPYLVPVKLIKILFICQKLQYLWLTCLSWNMLSNNISFVWPWQSQLKIWKGKNSSNNGQPFISESLAKCIRASEKGKGGAAEGGREGCRGRCLGTHCLWLLPEFPSSWKVLGLLWSLWITLWVYILLKSFGGFLRKWKLFRNSSYVQNQLLLIWKGWTSSQVVAHPAWQQVSSVLPRVIIGAAHRCGCIHLGVYVEGWQFCMQVSDCIAKLHRQDFLVAQCFKNLHLFCRESYKRCKKYLLILSLSSIFPQVPSAWDSLPAGLQLPILPTGLSHSKCIHLRPPPSRPYSQVKVTHSLLLRKRISAYIKGQFQAQYT